MSTRPSAVAVHSPRALDIRPNASGVMASRNLLTPLESATTYDSLANIDEPAAATAATTSRLAAAAAVCALLGFLHVSGFVAGILLGHVALVQIHRNKGRLRGRRLARVALLVSWTPVILVAAVFVLMFLIGLHTASNG